MKERNSFGKFTAGILLSNLFAVIAAFMLLSLFGTIFNGAFEWFSISATILLYIFLIYHEGWVRGSSDYNLVLYQHSDEKKWKGEVSGLFASIPTIILGILSILVTKVGLQTVVFIEQDLMIYLYRFWHMPFQIMYSSLDKLPILYFLPVIVMTALTSIGYRLGYHQIRLSDYLFYARKGKNNNE